eukprot:7644674-Alexandrium_andersonii.AAC.1
MCAWAVGWAPGSSPLPDSPSCLPLGWRGSMGPARPMPPRTSAKSRGPRGPLRQLLHQPCPVAPRPRWIQT